MEVHERKVPKKYVRIVQDMYEGVRTQVCSSVGVTDSLPVKVGLLHGSSLNPYLFDLIMDVLAHGIKGQPPGVCYLRTAAGRRWKGI